MHTVSPQAKKEFVSTYDQAIAAGMEKGMERGIEKGMLQGMERGMLQGRQEGIRRTAKNMKNIGLDIQSIIQTTGLSAAEIEKL